MWLPTPVCCIIPQVYSMLSSCDLEGSPIPCIPGSHLLTPACTPSMNMWQLPARSRMQGSYLSQRCLPVRVILQAKHKYAAMASVCSSKGFLYAHIHLCPGQKGLQRGKQSAWTPRPTHPRDGGPGQGRGFPPSVVIATLSCGPHPAGLQETEARGAGVTCWDSRVPLQSQLISTLCSMASHVAAGR